jgi:NAD(P)-dependent dehydrogenase (short-subunit alcohol dehydrogenase family)
VVAPTSGRLDLGGQIAFVVGATGGIGRATVAAFVREGATVAIGSLRPAEGSALVEELRASGGQALAFDFPVDVTDRASVQRAVDATVAQYGRIDIAVSGAGVVSGTPLEEIDDDNWYRVLDINLKGTLHVLQAVYPVMRAAGSGKIVCIGSIAAQQGGVSSGAHYVAAKAGVHGMVKWLAKDAAQYGVTANVVSPGPVMTPMWIGLNEGVEEDGPQYSPLGRVGRAEDVAEAILFLASPMANWITGATLDVNGGLLMR